MKQNLPPAKARTSLFAFGNVLLMATLILASSACATLPKHASSETQVSLDVPQAENGLRININTASPPELERLPGVGKVIAERIVAHRQQYGPFRRKEHLMLVRGISDQKFRALRPMIVVNDLRLGSTAKS